MIQRNVWRKKLFKPTSVSQVALLVEAKFNESICMRCGGTCDASLYRCWHLSEAQRGAFLGRCAGMQPDSEFIVWHVVTATDNPLAATLVWCLNELLLHRRHLALVYLFWRKAASRRRHALPSRLLSIHHPLSLSITPTHSGIVLSFSIIARSRTSPGVSACNINYAIKRVPLNASSFLVCDETKRIWTSSGSTMRALMAKDSSPQETNLTICAYVFIAWQTYSLHVGPIIINNVGSLRAI